MLAILLGALATFIGILWLIPQVLGCAWPEARDLIVGFLSLGLVGGGLIAVAAGISSLKDNIAAKKREAKRGKNKKKEGEGKKKGE